MHQKVGEQIQNGKSERVRPARVYLAAAASKKPTCIQHPAALSQTGKPAASLSLSRGRDDQTRFTWAHAHVFFYVPTSLARCSSAPLYTSLYVK